MTQYKYRTVDEEGTAVEGTMDASSARQVTRRLQERGLTVNTVEELHAPKGLLRVSPRLTWDELALFSDQLSAVARSDLPLAPALRALSQDLRGSRLKPVLDGLHKDLEAGATLEEALRNQHEAFPKLYATVIQAGESSGNLSGVLQLLCRHSARLVNLRHSLRVALTYPAVLLVLGTLILWFMLVKVVPVFAEIFGEFGAAMPAPTRFWVGTAQFMAEKWTVLIIGACLVIIATHLGGRMLRQSPSGRSWLDWVKLHVPVLGRLYYLMAVERFARTLALLLYSRVAVLDSLELAAAASDSAQLQRAVDEAILQVASGETISDSLAGTGFFGHHFCWLLGTSEERGEVEQALDALADSYQREVGTRDNMIAALLSPAIVVILGLLIASVVISLYLPIFTLGDAVSGT